MSNENEFNQAMQGWLNQMSSQQQAPNASLSQTSQPQQSPFQSLGTVDLVKGGNSPGSLGTQLSLDSRNTLGVTQHTFSENGKGTRFTELRQRHDGHKGE
jgi:hypothetical protein